MSTTGLRVRVAHAERAGVYPRDDDDALGLALWGRLCAAIPHGMPRPALFTFFPEVAQIVDLPPVLAAGGDVHRAIAAFASQPEAEAIAAAGVMVRRRQGRVVGRAAMVFLEWPDGRWWACAHPLDGEGQFVAQVPDDLQRAVDGAPKPAGLGAWFRRARFEGLSLRWGGELLN